MKFEIIKTVPGSPEPDELFEPHMPSVGLFSDMDAFFGEARKGPAELAKSQDIPIIAGPDVAMLGTTKDTRYVAMVTPGRGVMYFPVPEEDHVSSDMTAFAREFLDADRPLTITAIAYTKLEAFMEDGSLTRCIPFLGHLVSFAFLGHSVLVFEGHQSAFEPGVRNSDLVLVDSAMLPFLQDDWVEVAHRLMPAGSKILVHVRDVDVVVPVIRDDSEKGWYLGEPDGEVSYVNCLLTTLEPDSSIRVCEGSTVPNLAVLTDDPKKRAWIAELPFDYEELDAKFIIDTILRLAGWRWYTFMKKAGTMSMALAKDKGRLELVAFRVVLTKDAQGQRQITVSTSQPGKLAQMMFESQMKAAVRKKGGKCPKCGAQLRTPLARQCLECGHDWH
jgi:hypothetical protein